MKTSTTTQQQSTSDTSWVANGKKPLSRLSRTTRRRSVPYLLLGLILIIGCSAAFLVLWQSSDARQVVLALARPVTVGQVVTEQDLRQTDVAVDAEVKVVDARETASVVGRTMSVSLPAGVLLSPGSFGTPAVPVAGQAIASLSVNPGQFPQEIVPGARVSVVRVPSGSASPPGESVETWSPGVVTHVAMPRTDQSVVVSVQLPDAAARRVAAIPVGQVSLVLLGGGW